jgi:hypothetical protein
MNGVFVAAVKSDAQLENVVSAMDKATQAWTMRAARGECAWVCSDCCVSFPKGMPDACEHGHQKCTDIIQRDKTDARKEL